MRSWVLLAILVPLVGGCVDEDAAPAQSPAPAVDLKVYQECIATYPDGSQALCRDPRRDARFIEVDGFDGVPADWACLSMTSQGTPERHTIWGIHRGRMPTDGVPDLTSDEVLGLSFNMTGAPPVLNGFARKVGDDEAPYTTFTLRGGQGFVPMPGAVVEDQVEVEGILVAPPRVAEGSQQFDELVLSWGEHDEGNNWTRSYPTLVADLGDATLFLPAVEQPKWDAPRPPPLLRMDAKGYHDDTVVKTQLGGSGTTVDIEWDVTLRLFAILSRATSRNCDCPARVVVDGDPAQTAECAVTGGP